ncbi:MerR family transcriptional regulator [Fibrisoma montanum]|uniref:MerR family transcriptional regulator n=1 Tax=Fibrisoma montanum TaxID=2305895 RepID=A0A418MJ76_9BACT|nr:MerR family transcriptional regulator [Fibrisoma montanum]RIV27474.1 MerR family transcriptional regulator [Fibrisoma montanum]
MKHYSVRKLAKLAGVSVRTLHHYDRLGLLRPSVRTEARYRLYGEDELIRLQQILFYKELDFPLTEIKSILDAPDFNLLTALQSHRQALEVRRDRLSVLLDTIDKTMVKLKGKEGMLTDEELYAGFPRERAEAYRQEAVAKYGARVVEESESKLRQMGKLNFDALKADASDIAQSLVRLRDADPTSPAVQAQIARHYVNIRMFWGDSVGGGNVTEAYKGLAQLYVDDLRYTASYLGHEDPAFAAFLNRAMVYFADTQLAQ